MNKMKKVKIPKLKPEEKEQIIENYFRKKEGDKKVAETIQTVLSTCTLAFLAVFNIIVAGVFFLVAVKTKSGFATVMVISSVCTSVLISNFYVQFAKQTKKKR